MNRKRLNLRFVAAVVASSIIITLLLMYNAFEYYSPGAYGNWIVRYRTPLEVMISTTLALSALVWLYLWYRRDRVAQAYTMLNDEERERLLDRLLAQRYDALLRDELAGGGKRKRDETEFDDEESIDDQPRRLRSRR